MSDLVNILMDLPCTMKTSNSQYFTSWIQRVIKLRVYRLFTLNGLQIQCSLHMAEKIDMYLQEDI